MGIFSSIWNKITGHKPKTAPQQTPAPTAQPAPGAAPAATPALPPVDVEAVLSDLAESKGGGGNWRTSIVDLMKLLDLDSSLTARKQLADELHYTGDKEDSATMNVPSEIVAITMTGPAALATMVVKPPSRPTVMNRFRFGTAASSPPPTIHALVQDVHGNWVPPVETQTSSRDVATASSAMPA